MTDGPGLRPGERHPCGGIRSSSQCDYVKLGVPLTDEQKAKAVGTGFLLKFLMLYYPDQFIQINSLRWIDRIIDGFGRERKPSSVENNQTFFPFAA